MVTSAILRTCAVKLPAIMFTLSVKSFQTPLTSRTWAWPPSLPSVPTSRATRVTSAAKPSSCFTIALTIFAVRRNSPLSGWPSASSATVWVRSPLATAPITRAISVVGRTRSSIKWFTALTLLLHEPDAPGSTARCDSRPSLPTTRLTRSISLVLSDIISMMSLMVSAILPSTPVQLPGSLALKSPFFTEVSTCSSSFESGRWL